MTTEEHKLIASVFTVAEIEFTGTPLAEAPFEVLHTLVAYRKKIGLPVYLVKGGLTTGKHEDGSLHYLKKAVDFHHGAYGVSLDRCVETLLRVGFKGIGVYNNTVAYSFHADLRADVTLWSGTKLMAGDPWKYGDLVGVDL